MYTDENVRDYLENQLKLCSYYSLSDRDRDLLAEQGVETYIFQKLTSKQYRKWSLSEDTKTHIRRAVKLAVQANKPLLLTFPFGGYKLWRLSSLPQVDWAEFFCIAYSCEWLAPILSVYKPGVELTFLSGDFVVERMSNIPRRDTETYISSFNNLLSLFRIYTVPNLVLKLQRIADLYENLNDLESELQRNVATIENDYVNGKVDEQDDYKQLRQSAELNICWDGSRNLSGVSAEERESFIRRSIHYHMAYHKLQKRVDYDNSLSRIGVFVKKRPNTIPIGTTRSCVTKFWTGTGVLESRGDTFLNKILSPRQNFTIQDFPHTVINVRLCELNNFQDIRVFSEALNFSRT